MSTSGIYSMTVTRDDILRQAMLNIRRLDPSETLTAEETTDCSRVLNMLVKQWQGKSDFAPGLKVWTRKTGYRLLSASAGSYPVGPTSQGWTNAMMVTKLASTAAVGATTITLVSTSGISPADTLALEMDDGSLFYTVVSGVSSPTVTVPALAAQARAGNAAYTYTSSGQKPLAIETAWLRDDTYSDTPLNMMNVQDWSNLPNKEDVTDEGDPTAIYWEDGLTTGTLYTDVGSAQDVSKYIVMKYLAPVQVFSNPLDEAFYPEEWFLALCWGLSEQICPMFGANWTQQMEGLKTTAMMIARNKGVENSSLFFQPGIY